MTNPSDQRLTNIESAIMHLQQDVESLSDSLVHQAGLIDELKKSIGKLTASVETLEADDEHSAADEKPPHY